MSRLIKYDPKNQQKSELEVFQDKVRKEKELLRKKINKLTRNALKELEDRVQNGDFFFDQKAQQLIRRPISADTANRILQESVKATLDIQKAQKQDVLVETEEKIADRLIKLAKEFTEFQKLGRKSNIIDAEFKEVTQNALHDEREEGLQEGTEVGPLQTRPGETTGS